MPRITVCIPAYRSGAKIAETLQSVRDQTFTDFIVKIAVEPTGEGDIDADVERDFASDPRFRFYRNRSLLGWAGNIDRLMSGVETEFFAILPHDDMWYPAFLSETLDALEREPDASVAFSDIERIGGVGGSRQLDLDNSSIGGQLFSFYLGTASATPWRGLTRRSVLATNAVNFPDNPFRGYGAESEWAQYLLARGIALRVPRELYRKRDYERDYPSVSRGWVNDFSREEKEAASELHRERMLAGIPPSLPKSVGREAVVLACEVAMLRRAWGLGRLPLTGLRRERAQMVRAAAEKLRPRPQRYVLRYLDRVVRKIELGSIPEPVDRGSA